MQCLLGGTDVDSGGESGLRNCEKSYGQGESVKGRCRSEVPVAGCRIDVSV